MSEEARAVRLSVTIKEPVAVMNVEEAGASDFHGRSPLRLHLPIGKMSQKTDVEGSQGTPPD